ncbi:hypothetical protein V3G39_09785 [Dermatophilaceae bacterium Sec6.4]
MVGCGLHREAEVLTGRAQVADGGDGWWLGQDTVNVAGYVPFEAPQDVAVCL